MPDSLARIRRTVAGASGATDRTLPAMAELGRHAGEWLLLLLPIAERLAESEPYCATGTGDIECALCDGEEGRGSDYRATFRHDPDCPVAMARKLKGGVR